MMGNTSKVDVMKWLVLQILHAKLMPKKVGVNKGLVKRVDNKGLC
jgi:hypothetical protein